MAWAFGASTLTLNDVLPPTKPYLLIFLTGELAFKYMSLWEGGHSLSNHQTQLIYNEEFPDF